MNITSNNDHDHFFKAVLSDPAKARDFMTQHFPAERLALCDLSTLKLESETFIDTSLKNYCSDLLWSMRTKSGSDGFIYWLMEHQSTPDPMMAFRMMNYSIAVMYRHFRQNKRAKLPLVIPVLFYMGKQNPYPYSLSWYSAFENPDMAASIYGSPFQLINVAAIPDDQIPQHKRVAIMEYLFKKVATGSDLQASEFGRLLEECRLKGYTDDVDIITALTYAIQAAPIPESNAFVADVMAQLPYSQEKIMSISMTIKETYIQEGMRRGEQRGKQEGIQIGELRGIQKSRLEITRNLLNAGMPLSDARKFTQLSDDEIPLLNTFKPGQ